MWNYVFLDWTKLYCSSRKGRGFHLEGCEFIETIETVTKTESYKSKVGILEKRDERYVFTLPERQVLYSMLSKTRVKAKLIDPKGTTLLAVRFIYDVK